MDMASDLNRRIVIMIKYNSEKMKLIKEEISVLKILTCNSNIINVKIKCMN
jgi:hypothetical protein